MASSSQGNLKQIDAVDRLPMQENSAISPRLRVYDKLAEFETERHLEWFFLDVVLPNMGLSLLSSQYSCKNGICDILALGPNKQLIIIELKNTQDSHVIEQITKYFDALIDAKPFSEQVDYTQPIGLYTVCPDYAESTATILKYHQLNFDVLGYRIEKTDQDSKFILFNWLSNETVTEIAISLTEKIPAELNLPDPPKSFVDLIGKCSEQQRQWASQIRDQIYEFAHRNSHKVRERPDGQWTRFERTKQFPIAEIGWDGQRNKIAIHLWLPFATVNGIVNKRSSRSENYKRTSMMKLWVEGETVTYVGYVENSRRRCITVTIQELIQKEFPQPTKLNKWLKNYGGTYYRSNQAYWKGLAMPVQVYKEKMDLDNLELSLEAFVSLALQHSFDRSKSSRSKLLAKQKEA